MCSPRPPNKEHSYVQWMSRGEMKYIRLSYLHSSFSRLASKQPVPTLYTLFSLTRKRNSFSVVSNERRSIFTSTRISVNYFVFNIVSGAREHMKFRSILWLVYSYVSLSTGILSHLRVTFRWENFAIMSPTYCNRCMYRTCRPRI